MVRAIRHRGPDGEGIWTDPRGHTALGHARLAIIDVTETGKQPMISRDGNFVLTLNGEIYNYVELRRELLQAGLKLRGTSDTEVLLEAMAHWGIESTLARSRGMFAMAVWDIERQCLWLARDRVGKKPLYFYDHADTFMFASEIKGLLAAPDVQVTISQQSLSDYLSLGFILGSDTIYREISEVRPGTLIKVGIGLQTRQESVYWRFPAQTARILAPEEIQEETEKRLSDAVRLRLRADVPVGVFLSGGIDSGLITAFAATQSREPIHSFTVAFSTSTFDESRLARLVAQRYATIHHEIYLNPDLEELLPKVVRTYDEPFADPSALPTYAISGEAAKRVKVVLNGEGADELFGGYRRVFAMRWLAKIDHLLRKFPPNTLRSIADALPRPRGFRSAYSFLHRFARAAQADSATRYLLWSSDGFDHDEKQRLGLIGAKDSTRPTAQALRDCLASYKTLPALSEFMAFDFLVGMADCLLPKIDMATMAHGLEGRSPFLDQEVVEWAAGIDKSALLAGWKTKPVLRAIASRHLPSAVTRAPKRGFEIPLVQWMKHDLHAMAHDICASRDSILFDLFDRREVLAVLNRQVLMDDERWAKRMWTLLMLAYWGRCAHEDRLHCA